VIFVLGRESAQKATLHSGEGKKKEKEKRKKRDFVSQILVWREKKIAK